METKTTSLEECLKEFGFDAANLSDKEKLKVLKQIIFQYGVDRDLEELKYTRMSESEKTSEKQLEFTQKIQNLDVNIMNIQRYILMLKYIKKEERKLKFKKAVQKIFKRIKK